MKNPLAGWVGMRWQAAALPLVVLLAGCSGGGQQAEATDDGFGDLEVEVTATTGAIRGIVVDERITPIEGASITLRGPNVEQAATSDVEGRFRFSNLAPGSYFLEVTSPLHQSAQTTVDVVAGVAEPPVTKVLLSRLFAQEPFVEQYKHDGFIQCNQAGVGYATAPCITDFTGLVTGNGVVPPGCTQAGCAPQLRQVQQEQRGFHVAVGQGWQALIWELTWDESSDTFERMGLTVSYNVTQRCACHNYASVGGTDPVRVQIDLGEDHEDSADNEPDLIPPEGRPDLYYFVGVRSSGGVPALAVNQPFQLFATFFYYGIPPEGWSLLNGDDLPF